MYRILAVDPGLNGALVMWDGETLIVQDVPIMKAKTRGYEINLPALVDLVNKMTRPRVIKPYLTIGYVEKNQSRPNEGGASGHKAGLVAGTLLGCVAMRCHYVVQPRPNQWKKKMNLTKDKNYSITKAIQLFPTFHEYFARKKDHDRAEAALLALYGFQEQNG